MDTKEKNVNEMLKDVNNSIQAKVSSILGFMSDVKWHKISFVIPMVPVPSHRPRLCGYRVYVPCAAKNQSFFNKHVLPGLHGLFITTPCKMKIDIYCQTPRSFTKTQQILAEMKILRPWGNTGDVDNFAKAVMDQMMPNEKRGHIGILQDDCLVTELDVKKYYSRTPRYEVTITYMENVPESVKKILRLN